MDDKNILDNENIWAIVPAFNEDKNISEIVSQIKKYIKNVAVVDDGSTDDTYNQALNSGAYVLKHIINVGKGAALKTGCDYAIAKKARCIVVLDADAQHNPDEIPHFLDKLKDYDIVFGYRGLSRNMPLVLRLGNWFISNIINTLFKVRLYDTQSGYRAFTIEAYKKIRWISSDYSMESEMVANAGRNKLKYIQIPIQTIYSDNYKGTTIIDGIKIVANLIWWKLFNH